MTVVPTDPRWALGLSIGHHAALHKRLQELSQIGPGRYGLGLSVECRSGMRIKDTGQPPHDIDKRRYE